MPITSRERNKSFTVAFRINESLREKLETLAHDEQVSLTQIVRWALNDYVGQPRRSRSREELRHWEQTERQGDIP